MPPGVIEAETSVKFCPGFARAGVSLQGYLRASLGGTVFLTRDGPGLSMGRTGRGGAAGKILGEIRAWALPRCLRCHLCMGPGHIAFCVSDIDQSSTFFRDTLGITFIIDQVQDTKTGRLLHVYRHVRQTRRTAHLAFWGEPAAPGNHLALRRQRRRRSDQAGPGGRQPLFLLGAGCIGVVQRTRVRRSASGCASGSLDQRPEEIGELLHV